ncbi:hypothetical protein P175DRAFT_0520013 [Aspergillus ochraceoroseus IBT 24754]|uniref:Uncharacterized protein n=3 Tax=Aspergillus subgen. Nidulantes TaxID=2720870 RepID=A0A0F8V2A9_9EURO|nr:uncharacterized protein P175DRAFT_0520013 [Aspergillus ochraceoroseus IBT 24754]KKK22907.1 hypothetical protein AOCH_000525 [Aspergillus ochraceoroseus]KKK25883.1 hypothetical protein ARAM_004245 [Aspergillus rambellii]PTU24029.1 hypothetical protein P175DRAFT_0520013 [Aspergillus ochraceoroseus IBT 24754]
MSDVRSLLRSELASRRGSPQTGSSTPNRVTKKRKVDPSDGLARKKVRHANADQLLASAQIRPPSAQAISEGEDIESTAQETTKQKSPSDTNIAEEEIATTEQQFQATTISLSEATTAAQAVDEDEWAAFQREVVAPTRTLQRPAAVIATATISAAPISTEELAELQEKESEALRRNHEAEVEGEREDAARFMEEEFDEMEQLEERLKRLKQMREQLRMKRATEDVEPLQMDERLSAAAGPGEQPRNEVNCTIDDKDDEEDEDDDDIDDDWDNWRFR